MRSSALIPVISSSNISVIPGNSSSAAIEVIQGLMDGLGWHNLSSSIHQAEAEQELADQKLTTAIKFYLEEQDVHSRSRLIKAINETLQATQSEYDHAVKQQQHYQKQAEIEAEQKSVGTSSYLGQWSYWVYDGIKNFFGSTTEQQIEKYQQIAEARQARIETISHSLQTLLINENDSELTGSPSMDDSSAHFPAVIELASLNGIQGFKLDGENNLDFSGNSVSAAGDINGDGFDDLIIGAKGYPAGKGVGRSYVVFGKPGVGGTGILNLSSLIGTNGFKLDGEYNGDMSGISVSAAGDINADGQEDLLIGAYLYMGQGRSYVVFGGSKLGSSGIMNLSSLSGLNGFKLDGENFNDYSGNSVSAAGDINGDGFDDLIIGASSYPAGNSKGRSYVVFGKPGIGGTGIMSLSSLTGANGFKLDGEYNRDFSGNSVSAAGDINGDGHDDLIIGAYGYPADSYKGRSYVVFGGLGVGGSGILNLSGLTGANGFKLDGENNNDWSGYSVSEAGDINGDEFDDLIIGASDYPAGKSVGRSYVVFGKPGVGGNGVLSLSSLTGANGFKLDGDNDESGRSVSAAGDVNGDGQDDLIIGGGDCSYVVFGGPKIGGNGILNLSSLTGANGFKLDGDNDWSGISVSAAGDINADGVADLVIGVFWYPANTYNGRSYVVFGDIPPVIVNNSLSLDRGEKISLTSIDLAAYDKNHDNSSLVFIPTNISHGHFEKTNQPGMALMNFTQQEIKSQQIQFVHDGSLDSPTYNITVRSAGIAWTGPSSAIIYFNPMPIVLVNNQLAINQSQTIQLTTINLFAKCDIPNSNLTFTITNISRGSFSVENNIVHSSIVNFPQQAIDSKLVSFTQDGSPYAPQYQIAVNDTWIQTASVFANITFNITPIDLINNQCSIKQNETVLLTSKELLATRNNNTSPDFKFVITNISHGFFIANQQKSSSQITFAQQVVLSGNVTFTHDGSMNPPTYWVAMNDGWNQTNPQAANITFILKPVFIINQFLVSLNQSTLLSLNNLCVNDCYDDAFDKLQFNLVGDVTNGQFENTSIPSTALTSFTQKNVKQNQIQFVSNGISIAPRYELEVMDPTTLLTGSSIGSTLLVTRNYLPINQNQTFYLTVENLNVTSSSGLDTDIIFTPVANTVQHGYFSLASTPGMPIATFKQDQINKNQIAFVPDGSSSDPGCILGVRDSQSTGASGSFPCLVDFATAPRLDHAFLKINPPDSIQLTISNLEASDDKVSPDQLYFMVSDVQNDHFAYSSDFKNPIVNFTQAEVSAGKVYFIANSDNPPAFTVSVWNGRLYCQNDCPRVATIVAPDAGGENGLSSLLIGLLSSFGTLVLLPLVKCYFEKAVKAYFSSREDTPDSQVTNEALARLWIGCCGVITHRQHEEYVIAFGHVIDKLAESKQGISLRERWQHLGDRQKREIKWAIAEKSEEILVGSQSRLCRFFKSFCHSEATPQKIEEKAAKIAKKVKPYISQLFIQPGQNIQQPAMDGSIDTPLLIKNPTGSISLSAS